MSDLGFAFFVLAVSGAIVGFVIGMLVGWLVT